MAPSSISIAAIGTLDTKLVQYLYLRSQILRHEPLASVILIDAGRSASDHEAVSVSQAEVVEASGYQGGDSALKSLPRGELVKTLIDGSIAVVRRLYERGEIHAIIGLGGSGGTSIASAAMRQLPLTFPKLIVSTVASGDTSSYVAETDITMMYSIVDIAGLNEVLTPVIDNAAAAIVGMAKAYAARISSVPTSPQKRGVGATMFGVTTKGVDAARTWLESEGFEVYVFHATGAGGRAMERLAQEGRLHGVMDMTTTELADELVGGVFSAGKSRLTGVAKAGIPQIVSVGALDMVNFGPRETLPRQFEGRNIYVHNPSVTLVRTTEQECTELGNRVARRLRENSIRPELTEVWLPLKGTSAIAVEGQKFHDTAADKALFAAIKKGLDGSAIKVVEVDSDINDAKWSEGLARRLKELIEQKNGA
ncbi:hypothetical protein GGS23DRAFT_345692 [Durotheca rogersii]|uniref:uncharacterized protein n=1 Tax=Durotheca rogersii TaxID=419775 RepID=UPI00221E43CA|nr:uncharacterized protein GGS23DRAFT_345692 [Durotheca rogersii]KAI5857360.1 hypothetical protein GGS23DRAFT_345692 [Durotheca rogersii]